jgi:hypothetical protein
MSRRLRWWLLAVILVVAIGAVAVQLLPKQFEGALRAPINDYLRERTLAMLNETDVAGLSVGFESLDLSFLERHLIINGIRIRYDHRDSTRYVRFQASTPRVTLEGLDLGDVIRHESLRLDAVRISSPTLSQHRELTGVAAAPEAVAVTEEDSIPLAPVDLDTLLYHAVAAWLPDEIRQARIDLIAFDHASILSTTERNHAVTKDSIGNIALEIRGLGLDSLKRRVFETVSVDVPLALHVSGTADSVQVDTVGVRLDGHDTLLTVRRVRSTPANPEKSALYAEGIRRSNGEQKFTLDTLNFGPRINDAGWLRRGTKRRSRIRLNLGSLQVDGGQLRRALGERVEVRRIGVGSLSLDVLADRRFPKTPPKPRQMWPQRLAGVDWAVRIDTVSVQHGKVQYGEINAGRPEVAQLYFSDINALLTNVGNAEGYGGKTAPRAVLDAKAKLMGKGDVHAHMEIPQTPKGFTTTVKGSLGTFAAKELNPMLLLAAGVTLKSGRIDNADFDFKVEKGVSAGRFSTTFDSLSLDIVNRVSQKRGLKEKLMGKVANAMVRNSNQPGEKSYRPEVPIKYELKPSDSFWGMIWQSVKAGLMKMMKD